MLAAVDDCIPKVNAIERHNPPWISKELIKLCRKKKAALKRAKKSGKTRDWSYYKKLNAMVKKNCNSVRRKYITDLSEEITHNNSKPFWRYVNSKQKGTNDLVLLKLGENEITENIDIAESMNTYLSSVFTEESFYGFPTIKRVVQDELCNVECT